MRGARSASPGAFSARSHRANEREHRERRGAGAITLAVALCPISTASAHGFGQRVDLPIPLWLWMVGAGLTVVLSFAAVIDFLPRSLQTIRYPRRTLLHATSAGAAGLGPLIALARVICVGLLALTLIAAFAGSERGEMNPAPTLVWVVFWVGAAFASALLGDLWALLNPLRTIFATLERGFSALTRRPLARGLSYPSRLAAWPAVVVAFAFAWGEHVWSGATHPPSLGVALLIYCALTFSGMFFYGRDVWLQNGDAFSLLFRLFASFAPFEVRVRFDDHMRPCGQAICAANELACINGDACLSRRPSPAWRLNLRPPAAGLLERRNLTLSHVVFVLVALAGVTFDGLIETAAWQNYLAAQTAGGRETLVNTLAHASGADPAALLTTLGLLACPLAFALLFLITCALMARLDDTLGGAGPVLVRARNIACGFVQTLIPIAIAYHLAHYLSVFVALPELARALWRDPLGGSASFDAISAAAVAGADVNVMWTLIVGAIIAGHVLSVYLAHVTALDRVADPRRAVRAELPLLGLMVVYTMASLWILAQPIFS